MGDPPRVLASGPREITLGRSTEVEEKINNISAKRIISSREQEEKKTANQAKNN